MIKQNLVRTIEPSIYTSEEIVKNTLCNEKLWKCVGEDTL